jgi:Spy/CpxP family protein refolding chaperone
MKKIAFAVLGTALLFAPTLQAQHQPYSGLEQRAIKALSDQQIADLRAGRGMGLALAAELNGYPGPSHVIELGDQLGLDDAQRTKMRSLFEAMKQETIAIGERLIEEERELDRAFLSKAVTPESLETITQRIGATQAALRAAHLKYHLATVETLTPHQVMRYAELRGYNGGHKPHHHPQKH